MQEYPSVSYLDELLRRCHVPVTRNLRERMASIIDEEVTAETKDHVVIHYGFHEELDRAKETFETLDETLSEVGRQVLAKNEDLISLKVVFLPQVGFLGKQKLIVHNGHRPPFDLWALDSDCETKI